MADLILMLSPYQWALAVLVALCAGLIKGLIGFALPTIFIMGLSFVVTPSLALAAMILPTVVTNLYQAFRTGIPAAVASTIQFKYFLGIGFLCLMLSAQLSAILPSQIFLGALGGVVTFFSLLQLVGWQLPIQGPSLRAEITMGAVVGFLGGMSGVWGPPTVAYLTALNTPKRDQMRVQGVVYGLGAMALVFAHVISGILTLKTAAFSATLLIPAMVGMAIGTAVQDRIDQRLFKRITLIVLLAAGANLLRRAVMG